MTASCLALANRLVPLRSSGTTPEGGGLRDENGGDDHTPHFLASLSSSIRTLRVETGVEEAGGRHGVDVAIFRSRPGILHLLHTKLT
jgi:hypothetical protein